MNLLPRIKQALTSFLYTVTELSPPRTKLDRIKFALLYPAYVAFHITWALLTVVAGMIYSFVYFPIKERFNK